VFGSELAPVHAKNQGIAAKKIPTGLSLDNWIGEEWPESEKEDDDMENVSDADPNDWFPTEQTKKLSPEDKKELENKREQRKRQREGDPFLLQGDGTHETRAEDLGEDHGPTSEEISKIPVKVDDGTLGVHVEKKGILPAKSSKKSKKRYAVKKGPKLTKDDVSENEEKVIVDESDPLAEMIDWNKPLDEEMPHLERYRQDDTNLQSVKEALALEQKFIDQEALAEKNAQEMSKGKKKSQRKRKRKREREKEKEKTKEKVKARKKAKRTPTIQHRKISQKQLQKQLKRQRKNHQKNHKKMGSQKQIAPKR